MDNKILYMYALMILALIIGFFIGKVLRRSAYKERYENRLDELQYIEEEKYEKLIKSQSELESLQNLDLDHKDSFRIKNERLDSYVEKNNIVSTHIETVKKSNEVLTHNIPVVDDKINDALSDLEKVKNARNIFLKQIDVVNEAEANILELNRDIKSIEMLVLPATEKKNTLSLNVEKLAKNLEEKEEYLSRLQLREIDIKTKHTQKKSAIEKDLQESKIEEKTCNEILQKIEEKIIEGESVSKSDFLGLLDENRANSSKWFNRLYHTSKNLFKGEK